jgi:hypothetical protein
MLNAGLPEDSLRETIDLEHVSMGESGTVGKDTRSGDHLNWFINLIVLI